MRDAVAVGRKCSRVNVLSHAGYIPFDGPIAREEEGKDLPLRFPGRSTVNSERVLAVVKFLDLPLKNSRAWTRTDAAR